jgi:hypothetical protein
MGAQGTIELDFGTFPGASDASVAVTGQTGIVAGSLVEAWIRPVATADHTADEHMVETIKVMAGDIVAGTGFTIYGFNTSQLNEPLEQFKGVTGTLAGGLSAPQGYQQPTRGGRGTRIYGKFLIAWVWS